MSPINDAVGPWSIPSEFTTQKNNQMLGRPEYFGLICGKDETVKVTPGAAKGDMWGPNTQDSCNQACSDNPNCNYASHQQTCDSGTNDGDNIDECTSICLHSETCNNPIRMQQETTFVKASAYKPNQTTLTTPPTATTQPLTLVQVFSWSIIISIGLGLIYKIYQNLRRKMIMRNY